MRKINRQDVLKMVLVLALIGGVGMSMAAIGRFTPTHAIVEPVYCGSCHPDQVRELNATTHLPHFTNAVYTNAEAALAGSSSEMTTAEAVSGGCMMCHNTWDNRDRMYVAGYTLVENMATGDYVLTMNDQTWKNDGTVTRYDVAVNVTNATTGLPEDQKIRLGTGASSIKVYAQDLGTGYAGSLTAGTQLILNTDYALDGTTGIKLTSTAANMTDLTASHGAIKITYKVSNPTVSYKQMWADLSAISPATGYFQDDTSGKPSCGNLEKGSCHIVQRSVGFAAANTMAETKSGLGSGNGVYFQHEMAYTSAEYAAKQVKLCAVCHSQKLPPMDADGNPMRQDRDTAQVFYGSSHGNLQTNTSIVSSDWAHKQVQCIRCHSHAGIGPEDGLTGVRSN